MNYNYKQYAMARILCYNSTEGNHILPRNVNDVDKKENAMGDYTIIRKGKKKYFVVRFK